MKHGNGKLFIYDFKRIFEHVLESSNTNFQMYEFEDTVSEEELANQIMDFVPNAFVNSLNGKTYLSIHRFYNKRQWLPDMIKVGRDHSLSRLLNWANQNALVAEWEVLE